MSYLTFHHNSYYFQIRVPAPLTERFGKVVRVNLQTADRTEARPIALRLASDWLSRFDAARENVSLGGIALNTSSRADAPPTELEVTAGHGQSQAAPHACDESSTHIALSPLAETTQNAPGSSSGCKASSVSEGDSALFDAWKRLDRDREPGTVRDMQAALRSFRKYTKVPLLELTRLDVAGFRDHLLAQRLARATVSKRVGFISTLLQVGYDAGHLKQNVARGLKIPRARVPTLVRRIYTPAELRAVFSTRIYTHGFRPVGGGGEACVWIPMIAFVTGARLEEIAQLRTDDIVLDAKLGPLMRVTDQGPDQHLKTDGSRRMIPLHPDLLGAGFLDYVDAVRDARHVWLFPDLEPNHDGRRGGNFGKWFQRHLRAVSGCGIRDPRLVFHSFRHTFKTLCRAAAITEELHDALTGHVSSSVSRNYGEMPLEPLVEAIGRIVLPITLALVVG